MATVVPAGIGLFVGCGWDGSGSGCEPPAATDAGSPRVYFGHDAPPCYPQTDAIRGSSPRLILGFNCPGTSSQFLVAVKIDGQFHGLRPAQCADYGNDVAVDFGSWEPPDSAWHDVEMILDPLNLFEEIDETNNRATAQIRIVDPDVGLNEPLTGFSIADGPQVGQWVSQVVQGTPVVVRTTATIRGRYPQVVVTARADPDLNASTTKTTPSDCSSYPTGSEYLYYTWTPPGPGAYDVEFRVTAPGATADRDTSNNRIVRTLTVTP